MINKKETSNFPWPYHIPANKAAIEMQQRLVVPCRPGCQAQSSGSRTRALPPKQGNKAGHSHVGPRAQILEQSHSNNTGQAKKSVHASGRALVMRARFRHSPVAARSTETDPEQGISLQARGYLSKGQSQAKLLLPSRPYSVQHTPPPPPK